MEKLEKGYTKEELSAFMQEAFKAHKPVRRLDDGSWETYTVEKSQPATVETVENIPEKKGAWKRFKSLFAKS